MIIATFFANSVLISASRLIYDHSKASLPRTDDTGASISREILSYASDGSNRVTTSLGITSTYVMAGKKSALSHVSLVCTRVNAKCMLVPRKLDSTVLWVRSSFSVLPRNFKHRNRCCKVMWIKSTKLIIGIIYAFQKLNTDCLTVFHWHNVFAFSVSFHTPYCAFNIEGKNCLAIINFQHSVKYYNFIHFCVTDSKFDGNKKIIKTKC